MVIRKIHQIFFSFDNRQLNDFPVFVRSHEDFRNMGWEYKLWNERDAEELCLDRYPHIWETYKGLPYDIQRVDLAKYMIVDTYGGVFSDLDVLPKCHLSEFVNAQPYVFDRCSRANTIANDFFYVGPAGLPGLFDYFLSNLSRVNAIPVYRQRKMRYVFHTTGPDFFTRYLKRSGLNIHTVAISDRTFLDSRQRHRSVNSPNPFLEIVHHLSWAGHVTKACPVLRNSVGPSGEPTEFCAS